MFIMPAKSPHNKKNQQPKQAFAFLVEFNDDSSYEFNRNTTYEDAKGMASRFVLEGIFVKTEGITGGVFHSPVNIRKVFFKRDD
jgi:hypothetical protein